jgi:hypothetical protein
MPYRGESGPRIACAAHAAAESVGGCRHCQAPLCDPCTLYFAAEPYCRRCIGGVRRAWTARIGGGVAAVLLTMALGTGIMLSAIPNHVRAFAAVRPAPTAAQLASCSPSDVWLDQAERDVSFARYHAALHHLSLSQRDCPHSPRRDRLYALAYDGIGDSMGAIAAASRWVDSSGGARDACALFDAVIRTQTGASDPRCKVDRLAP